MLMEGYSDDKAVASVTRVIRKRKKEKLLSKSAFMSEELIDSVFKMDELDVGGSILVIDAIEVLPQLYIRGITDVTYIQYGDTQDEHKVVRNLGYTYVNITNKQELGKFRMSKKFDIILANPPYNGQAKLHQRFFNKACDMLRDGGAMTFIQPSLPVYSNISDAINDVMVKNLETYDSSVTIVKPTLFEGAKIGSELMITTLTKTKTPHRGINFKDRYNREYHNVLVQNISVSGVNVDMLSDINKKISALIKHNGSVVSNLSKNDLSDTFVTLPESRGSQPSKKHIERGLSLNPDWFTLIPRSVTIPNPKSENNNGEVTGIKVNSSVEVENCVAYFQSYFARFCASLHKYNMDLHAGRSANSTSSFVPVVDFSKAWTDEQLFDLAGFTEEEIAEVYRVIPEYY